MITYYIPRNSNIVVKKTVFDSGSEQHQVIDKDSTDYQAYLKWLEAGNTPLPADTGA